MVAFALSLIGHLLVTYKIMARESPRYADYHHLEDLESSTTRTEISSAALTWLLSNLEDLESRTARIGMLSTRSTSYVCLVTPVATMHFVGLVTLVVIAAFSSISLLLGTILNYLGLPAENWAGPGIYGYMMFLIGGACLAATGTVVFSEIAARRLDSGYTTARDGNFFLSDDAQVPISPIAHRACLP
jgi:phosphotransferase system  glucose/maltose/N-acetylglucosamine-specific IIC component